MTESFSQYSDRELFLAFLLVVGAGGATAIGAAVVFFPQLVTLAKKRVLAAALGFAGGVMLYVSMVDILGKSFDAFSDAGHSEANADIYKALTFFLGIFFMMAMNHLVNMLLDGKHSHNIDLKEEYEGQEEPYPDAAESAESKKEAEEAAKTKRDLQEMGIHAALAIALHNFPEGLVTFAVYLNDNAAGIVLALAIAIHNVPEGLCVAMPIYYATGNRTKAFLWGILSGISEPIGALVGWVILRSTMGGNTNGIMFGLVGGIMAYLAIDELIPGAYRYDPENTVVTWSIIIGMWCIAASLMLFATA